MYSDELHGNILSNYLISVTESKICKYKQELQLRWFLTAVVTVVNRRMLFSSLVGVGLQCFVFVVRVFCVIMYPLQICYCPHDHLTFRWLVSQQVKWRLRRKENSTGFVSVCFTAKIDPSVSVINTTRKNSAFTVSIFWVVIIPKNRSCGQIFRAGPFFIYTVLTCRETHG